MNLRRGRCAPEKREFAKRLRKYMTVTERAVWELVRRKSLGVRVHRQTIIYGYIVDFWIPKAALVVEIDGPCHKLPENIVWDKRRDQALTSMGIKTLRYESHLDSMEIVTKVRQELMARGIFG